MRVPPLSDARREARLYPDTIRVRIASAGILFSVISSCRRIAGPQIGAPGPI
jgi:hypothetical protein